MIDWRLVLRKILMFKPADAGAIIGACASLSLFPSLAQDANRGVDDCNSDTGNLSFPEHDLFTPLIASPSQPRLFISFINIDSDIDIDIDIDSDDNGGYQNKQDRVTGLVDYRRVGLVLNAGRQAPPRARLRCRSVTALLRSARAASGTPAVPIPVVLPACH